MLNPFFVVRLGQRVVVEDRLPVRLRREIVGKRGPPHDPVNMLGILPCVVHRAVAKVRNCKPVRGLQNLERLGLELVEAGIGFEDLGRALVLGLDPGHGAVAMNVLKPLIIVRQLDCGFGCRRSSGGVVRDRLGPAGGWNHRHTGKQGRGNLQNAFGKLDHGRLLTGFGSIFK